MTTSVYIELASVSCCCIMEGLWRARTPFLPFPLLFCWGGGICMMWLWRLLADVCRHSQRLVLRVELFFNSVQQTNWRGRCSTVNAGWINPGRKHIFHLALITSLECTKIIRFYLVRITSKSLLNTAYFSAPSNPPGSEINLLILHLDVLDIKDDHNITSPCLSALWVS